ncbi:hypothetical protein [Lysobacter humi (ex Lee et al. 2017)]
MALGNSTRIRRGLVAIIAVATLVALVLAARQDAGWLGRLLGDARAREVWLAILSLTLGNAGAAVVVAELTGERTVAMRFRIAGVYLASQVAKYVPGRVWTFLAQAAMLGKIRPGTLLRANVELMVGLVVLITGAGLAGLFASRYGYPIAACVLVAAWIAASIIVGSQGMWRVVVRVPVIGRRLDGLGVTPDARHGMRPDLLRAAGLGACLLGYCVGWGLLASIVVPHGDPAALVAALSLSYLVGIISLLPAGIGAREASLLMMGPVMDIDSPDMAALALAARAVVLVVDIGLAAVAGVLLGVLRTGRVR